MASQLNSALLGLALGASISVAHADVVSYRCRGFVDKTLDARSCVLKLGDRVTKVNPVNKGEGLCTSRPNGQKQIASHILIARVVEGKKTHWGNTQSAYAYGAGATCNEAVIDLLGN